MARSKRKTINVKTRFEVFKRDKFTCQYCGRQAPDVILQIDHIEPVATGGEDSLLNYATSCVECNAGKGARHLSDDSAVRRQKHQLDEIQERREQLNMMLKWHRELMAVEDEAVAGIADIWNSMIAPYSLTADGLSKLKECVRKFSARETVESMRAAEGTYIRRDEDGHLIRDSIVLAFDKIPAICRINKASKEKPYLRDLFYIRGILRNRVRDRIPNHAIYMMERAIGFGVPVEVMKAIASQAVTWYGFRRDVEDIAGEEL